MAILQNRVTKLETILSPPDVKDVHICRIITGTKGDSAVLGYRCDGLEIMRLAGETVEALQDRAFDTVVWPTGCISRKTFDLIEEGYTDPVIETTKSSRDYH